jgi:presenilin 1
MSSEAEAAAQDQEQSSSVAPPPEAQPQATVEETQPRENPQTRPSNPQQRNGETEDKLTNYLFCLASFHAVFGPVCICMILSSLCVVHINTEETRAAGAQALSNTYELFDLQDGNASQNFLASVGNTLIMVSVICVMTFVVVLLYKFRCMKFFYGYMIVVTTMLLGYFSTNMLLIAFQKYNVRVDWFSLVFVMYNFAIVGTLAIFYGRGIPRFISQGYLICTSVVLSWQLSFFGTWTAWTLLVALALYDLFAVLTPCGPLRKLAELMSRPDAPAIPGLLYEAALPNGIERPNQKKKENEDSKTDRQPTPQPHESQENAAMPAAPEEENQGKFGANTDYGTQAATDTSDAQTRHSSRSSQSRRLKRKEGDSILESSSRVGKIPLSLAMVYKLQIVDEEGLLKPKPKQSLFSKRKKNYQTHDEDEDIVEYSGLELRQRTDLTPKQLRTEVKVIYQSRGGRIEKVDDSWVVYNRSGDRLREFVVDESTGRVYQKGQAPPNKKTAMEDNTIKLGLGDFIFYSVLVSKAALYGFTSFAVCMLVILAGLGITLLLLSVYGKALPALPISIFFGVAFFFLSREVIDPWLMQMIRTPLYV